MFRHFNDSFLNASTTTCANHGSSSSVSRACFWLCLSIAFLVSIPSAQASAKKFHDLSSSCAGSTCNYSNTSFAGTITGTSTHTWAVQSTFGVPYAITPDNRFGTEYSANVGGTITLNFSSGYNWSSGGQMLIGNIHNCFRYTISAWDGSGNSVDVYDKWKFVAEYQSSAPGTLGYFSTSPTLRSRNADGISEDFTVNDPLADPNSGQGGVVLMDGLQNISKMTVTLTSDTICQNGQGSDLLLFNVASPITGPLTTVMNTLGQQKEVDEFYVGPDLHIYQLLWNGSWHYVDLTASFGAVPASRMTALASQIDEPYRRLEVFYVDAAQHVRELFKDAATPIWHQVDVTAISGAPPAAPGSSLVSVVNPYANSIQADYLDSSGHIHEVYSWNRLQWYTGDLTSQTSAPAAAMNSSLATELNKLANTVEIYFEGTDNHVRELWWSASSGWHNADPSASAGAPNAAVASSIVSLNNPIANTVQVDYVTPDQHIHELWWNGTWHTTDLTLSTGGPIAATGTSLATEVNTLNNEVELYFLGNDQTVQELWWNSVWHSADPSGSAGAPKATTGSPLVSLVNTLANSVQVHFVSTDDHVHEVYTWDWTNWYGGDVMLDSGAPPALP